MHTLAFYVFLYIISFLLLNKDKSKTLFILKLIYALAIIYNVHIISFIVVCKKSFIIVYDVQYKEYEFFHNRCMKSNIPTIYFLLFR